MHVPTRIQEAMQLQVEAERKKRAAILESEGAPIIIIVIHLSVSALAAVELS